MALSSKISIVIPTLNEALSLPACLEAIDNVDYPRSDIEVIVADTGSSDSTVQVAMARGIRVVHSSEKPPSAAAGLAAGMAVATGEFIQYVAADSLLHPQWLRTALAEYATDSKKSIGVVGGVTIERSPHHSLFNFVLALGLRAGIPTSPHEVLHNAGTGLIRTAMLATTGSFDPALQSEDEVDFGLRVRKAGFYYRKLPVPMITHDLGLQNNWSSLRAMLSRYWRQGIGRAQLWRKHAGTGELAAYRREVFPSRVLAGAPVLFVASILIAFRYASLMPIIALLTLAVLSALYAGRHYRLPWLHAFLLITWYAATLWIVELAFITHHRARTR